MTMDLGNFLEYDIINGGVGRGCTRGFSIMAGNSNIEPIYICQSPKFFQVSESMRGGGVFENLQ